MPTVSKCCHLFRDNVRITCLVSFVTAEKVCLPSGILGSWLLRATAMYSHCKQAAALRILYNQCQKASPSPPPNPPSPLGLASQVCVSVCISKGRDMPPEASHWEVQLCHSGLLAWSIERADLSVCAVSSEMYASLECMCDAAVQIT